MNVVLHSKTPEVTVIDNRDLSIRDIQYHRHPDSLSVTDERITLHTFNYAGFPIQSLSPRQYDLQQITSSIPANRKTISTLSGEILRTESTEEGTHLALKDIEGRLVISINAVGVRRIWQYENATLPGRQLSVTEQLSGNIKLISDRFIWAGSSTAEKNNNLAGSCLSHYHSAGVNHTDSIALTGNILIERRRLILDELTADWQDIGNAENNLSKDIFMTHHTYDTTGALLTQIDATGNQQQQIYNILGQLKSSRLKLSGQASDQIILRSVSYTAAGQVKEEIAGNGVVTSYSYEPETLRLIGIKTERPKGHANGAALLQDLRYAFDPVGNVISIRNDAEATRFWRNQKVVPESAYHYDSLYQLVRATGREMANQTQQINTFSSANIIANDDANYTNYTRQYSYDRDNNLIRIQHSAPATGNSHSTELTVSSRSNRAVLSTLTTNPNTVESFFDAAGNQLQLLPGQSLSWNSHGELQQVTPVTRNSSSSSDREWYGYDSGGLRTVKATYQMQGNSQRYSHKVYLSGLEKTDVYQNDKIIERYDRILMGNAQLLHWDQGLPSGITNNSLRYSHGDQAGSCNLETDKDGLLISREEFYPFGETAIRLARDEAEANYKSYRYSNKERDATGLYYYGFRYYQAWIGRWLSADPAGEIDGLNQYRMVRNNPITYVDSDGLAPTKEDVARRLISGIRARRANQALQRMEERGLYLRDGSITKTSNFKSWFFEGIPEFFYGNKQDLKQLTKNNSKNSRLELNEQENAFVEHFVRQDFYLSHATKANLLNEKNDLNIYSRRSLISKKIIFPKDNSTEFDVIGLGNDDYVFFSLEIGPMPSKQGKSRFGNIVHKISFSNEAFTHASLSLLDQIALTIPDAKIPGLSEEGKRILASRSKPATQDIFFTGRADSLYSLAHSIVGATRLLSQEDKDVILNERNPQKLDRITNQLFRPEVRIPRMVGVKQGDFFTFKFTQPKNKSWYNPF